MQDCWSFTCCFSSTLSSSLKRDQLKFFLLVTTVTTGSTSFFSMDPARYYDRLLDFSVTIPKCYKNVYVNSFFPRTANLWNSLPIELFPLTYDHSGFTSRI